MNIAKDRKESQQLMRGVFLMESIREGLIPTVLGTAVTTTGVALRNNRSISPLITSSIIGFGLAHIVLGAIDLVEHRR